MRAISDLARPSQPSGLACSSGRSHVSSVRFVFQGSRLRAARSVAGWQPVCKPPGTRVSGAASALEEIPVASSSSTSASPLHANPRASASGLPQRSISAPQAVAQVDRRSFLALGSSLALASSLLAPTWPAFAEGFNEGTLDGVPAAPEPLVDPSTTQFLYDFASDVPSNLRVREYYNIIVAARPTCWSALSKNIVKKEYDIMALAPTQAPFSDLRAAALYVPWALLQSGDYNAASDTRKAYVDFDIHVQDLKQIAEATAMDGATPEQVQQAFILLNASLEQLLNFIPPKYLI